MPEYQSGAAKRKKKELLNDSINKHPKIESFFKDTSSSVTKIDNTDSTESGENIIQLQDTEAESLDERVVRAIPIQEDESPKKSSADL